MLWKLSLISLVTTILWILFYIWQEVNLKQLEWTQSANDFFNTIFQFKTYSGLSEEVCRLLNKKDGGMKISQDRPEYFFVWGLIFFLAKIHLMFCKQNPTRFRLEAQWAYPHLQPFRPVWVPVTQPLLPAQQPAWLPTGQTDFGGERRTTKFARV